MSDKIGVAIVGCGGIAHSHLEAWMASSDLCNVYALSDLNPDALNALHAKIPSATAYSDYAPLLEREDIQVVEILTPPGLHFAIAQDAMLAGKDVLIIKPLCVELTEADQMIALSEAQGVRLMAGQPQRFSPHFVKARELLQSGRIGQPTRFYTRGFMRQEWLRKATHWFGDLSISGGITIENIVHQTDMMAWLAGPVVSAMGMAGTFHTADWPGGGLPDDQISFLLRFENQAIGVVEGGAAQPTGMQPFLFEITGTEGGITIDHSSLIVGRGVKESSGYAERYELPGRGEPRLVRSFLESIRDDAPVPVSAVEGRYAVELCWAALLSARENRTVTLPLPSENYPSYASA